MEYLVAYLLVGVVTSIGMSIWFIGEATAFKKIGFYLMNMFFYPATLALWIFNGVIGYKFRIKCPWCGAKVNFKDPEQIQEHVTHCKKHPTLTRIAELENEIAALKLRTIAEDTWEKEVLLVDKKDTK